MDVTALVEAWITGVNEGNLGVLDDLFAPEYVLHAPRGRPDMNREDVKQLIGMFREAFPDLHDEIHEIFAEGDRAAVRLTTSGTHEGSLFGVLPTHRFAAWTGMHFVRESNGQIVEHWSLQDIASMWDQLGEQPPS